MKGFDKLGKDCIGLICLLLSKQDIDNLSLMCVEIYNDTLEHKKRFFTFISCRSENHI